MEKIKIAIVGYGNVGRGVHRAIERNPDTSLVGIITRRPEQVGKEVQDIPIIFSGSCQWRNMHKEIDVAVLCGGSKKDLLKQGPLFASYFNTVDSFDTHKRIGSPYIDDETKKIREPYFVEMDKIAGIYNHVSIISAGWDPGTFSLERVLADALIPEAAHYTFWGPGVSQGHSDAARQVRGVKDARAYTIPLEEAMKRVRAGENPKLAARQKHERLVYVVAEQDADLSRIKKEIREMPNYFADYNTEVKFISEQEMKEKHSAMPHAGFVIATGATGDRHKAIIEYKCEWGSNPEATGNILVASARACYRLRKEGKTGAFIMLDIPPAYLSPHSHDELLKHFT